MLLCSWSIKASFTDEALQSNWLIPNLINSIQDCFPSNSTLFQTEGDSSPRFMSQLECIGRGEREGENRVKGRMYQILGKS